MEGEVTATMLDTVLGAVPKVIELSGTCLSAMIENPVYLIYVASGFVTLGLAMTGKLKRTARK